MKLTSLFFFKGEHGEARDGKPGLIVPARAMLHPLWIASLLLLALNDHLFKGAGFLPEWLTGKLSDATGLIVAPIVLATMLRVRSRRGLLGAHLAVGIVFSLINLSQTVSHAFVGILGRVGLPWVNWVDPSDLLALPAMIVGYRVLFPVMSEARQTGLSRVGLRALCLAGALPVLFGSGNTGGANEGQRTPGSGDTGIDVAFGEIAVDPSGRYFLARQSVDTVFGDLQNKSTAVLSDLPEAQRIAFWARNEGQGFFVFGAGWTLTSFDVQARAVRWSVPVQRHITGMKVSEHDGRVVLWAADWLGVYEPAAGEFVGSFAPNEAIRDVDLRHDTGQLIVTGDTVWEGDTPFTTVYVRKPADASAICQLKVPNCADELVLRPDGARAFLAPTFCAKDPVSVIDLSSCSFEKNLPGFGPVALSQNGQTAVAFIDKGNDDPTAPPLPEEVEASDSRYHLMMIDVDTLEYDTLAVGSELPRYAVTPDGQMLLVDAFMSENNVRILDIDTRSLRTIEGAYVLLENFVMHPNSRQVFGLYQGLFEIDVPAAKSRTIGLSFTPDSINMLPSGDMLLLKDRDSRIHMFDVASERVTGLIGM